mmetsp:Transcript_26018/g.40005  ORF Transcript_26018/g.40005 Transcript_26018/m.40005 type:complete len:127 (+) Transcript_26018:988-1368(+)
MTTSFTFWPLTFTTEIIVSTTTIELRDLRASSTSGVTLVRVALDWFFFMVKVLGSWIDRADGIGKSEDKIRVAWKYITKQVRSRSCTDTDVISMGADPLSWQCSHLIFRGIIHAETESSSNRRRDR